MRREGFCWEAIQLAKGDSRTGGTTRVGLAAEENDERAAAGFVEGRRGASDEEEDGCNMAG